MKRFMTFLATVPLSIVVLAFTGIAPPAFAGSLEERYCHSLADKYAADRTASMVTLDTATERCDAGDTRTGIALLEQALKDASLRTQAQK